MSLPASINLAAKLALIHDHWMPKVIAEMNDYQFKLVKLKGDFVWHSHADTDETFIVLAGVCTSSSATGRWSSAPVRWSWCRVAPNTVRTRMPSATCCWSSPAAWSTPAMPTVP